MKNNLPLSYLNQTAFISESVGNRKARIGAPTAFKTESVRQVSAPPLLSYLNPFIYLPYLRLNRDMGKGEKKEGWRAATPSNANVRIGCGHTTEATWPR